MARKRGAEKTKKKSKQKSLFVYSKHAQDRMAQRRVSKKEVEEAVVKAQERKQQPHGTVEATYTQGQSQLTVVYSKMNGGRVKIISTY